MLLALPDVRGEKLNSWSQTTRLNRHARNMIYVRYEQWKQNRRPSVRLIRCVSVKHTTPIFFLCFQGVPKSTVATPRSPGMLRACFRFVPWQVRCWRCYLRPNAAATFFWHIWKIENHLRRVCVAMGGIPGSKDRMKVSSLSLTCWEIFALKPSKTFFVKHKEQWEQLLLDTQGSSAPGQFARVHHQIGVWGCVTFDKVSVG